MPDMNQVPQAPQGAQAPQFDQEQFNNMIMQYLFSQMGKSQGQQEQQAEAKAAEVAPKSRIEEMIKSLMGEGQFGTQPHFSTLENILSRLEPSGAQQMNQSPYGNTASSSFMNAQDLANKPSSYLQQAGQFTGGALQDLAPLAGAAGLGAFGPLGALAAPVTGFAGRKLSQYSQPYQMPQQQGY